MNKFSTLKSIPAYLPIVNIDTDMIIPKQFLKTIKRTGLGKNLFYEMRYCLLYTSPSPRDVGISRMPSSA